MTAGKSPGQLGYEAYRAKAGGKSLVSGATLPGWEDLAAEIRDAWEAGAMAAIRGAVPAGDTEYRGGAGG